MKLGRRRLRALAEKRRQAVINRASGTTTGGSLWRIVMPHFAKASAAETVSVATVGLNGTLIPSAYIGLVFLGPLQCARDVLENLFVRPSIIAHRTDRTNPVVDGHVAAVE